MFIEFAVNDVIDGTSAEDSKRYMETIICTIYSYAPNSDIVMVFITGYLDRVFHSERTVEKIESSYIPKDNLSDVLIKPEMFNAKGETISSDFIITNEGYLRTDKDGATFNITFARTSLKMWTFAGHPGSILEYSIDGGETKSVTLSKSSDNHKIYELADDLKDENHTVKLTFKKSTGLKVEIRNFLVTGKSGEKNFSVTG